MSDGLSGVPGQGDAPARAIVSFRQDEEGHWLAELECGHTQHVRHDPPLVERPWVLAAEGRAARVGQRLRCVKCLEPQSP